MLVSSELLLIYSQEELAYNLLFSLCPCLAFHTIPEMSHRCPPAWSICSTVLEMSKRNHVNYREGRYKMVTFTDDIAKYIEPQEA